MNAYIVKGYRSAVGKAKKGGFRFTRPDDLAAKVIEHLTDSIDGFEKKDVDDLLNNNIVQIVFDGIDSKANVYINDDIIDRDSVL